MLPTVPANQSIGITAALCETHSSVRVIHAGRTLGIVTAQDCRAALHFGLQDAPIARIAEPSVPTAQHHSAPPQVHWADLEAQFAPALIPFLQQLVTICAQHDARIFLVGGVVRALFRHEVLTDLDVAIVGDFDVVIPAIAEATGGTIVQRSVFQTATLTFPPTLQAVLGMAQYDVVAARSEQYPAIGALPTVVPVRDIAVDMRRRDMTVNAMAVALLPSGPLPVCDPFGGWADVQAGRARMVHPLSFFEDPTRLIRLARIVARLGLRVDARLRARIAWAMGSGVCASVSRFRWLQELQRTCDEAHPAPALQLLQRWGVLAQIIPAARVRRADAVALVALPPADRLLVLFWRMPLAALTTTMHEWTELPVAYRQLVALRQTKRLWRAWLTGRPSRSIRALAGFDPLLLRAVALLEPLLAQLIVRDTAVQEHAVLHIKGRDMLAAGIPSGPAIGRVLEQVQMHLWDAAWAGLPADETAAQQLAAAIRISNAAGSS